MKIHEYQAKAVLSKYGVPVPRGEVAFTPEEVHDIAKRLFVSEHTVRSHVKSLLRKLGVSSRKEALEALERARL